MRTLFFSIFFIVIASIHDQLIAYPEQYHCQMLLDKNGKIIKCIHFIHDCHSPIPFSSNNIEEKMISHLYEMAETLQEPTDIFIEWNKSLKADNFFSKIEQEKKYLPKTNLKIFCCNTYRLLIPNAINFALYLDKKGADNNKKDLKISKVLNDYLFLLNDYKFPLVNDIKSLQSNYPQFCDELTLRWQKAKIKINQLIIQLEPYKNETFESLRNCCKNDISFNKTFENPLWVTDIIEFEMLVSLMQSTKRNIVFIAGGNHCTTLRKELFADFNFTLPILLRGCTSLAADKSLPRTSLLIPMKPNFLNHLVESPEQLLHNYNIKKNIPIQLIEAPAVQQFITQVIFQAKNIKDWKSICENSSCDLFNIATEDKKMPILFKIIEQHSSEVINSFCECGADINAIAGDQQTALHKAIDTNDKTKVETILKYQPNNQIRFNKQTFFEYSLNNKNIEIVKLLAGSLIKQSLPQSENEVRLELFQKILKTKSHELVNDFVHDFLPNPAIKDPIANTPLHYAVKSKNFEAIKLLLQRGAKINENNSYGKTPLSLAKNNQKLVCLLKTGKLPAFRGKKMKK